MPLNRDNASILDIAQAADRVLEYTKEYDKESFLLIVKLSLLSCIK